MIRFIPCCRSFNNLRTRLVPRYCILSLSADEQHRDTSTVSRIHIVSGYSTLLYVRQALSVDGFGLKVAASMICVVSRLAVVGSWSLSCRCLGISSFVVATLIVSSIIAAIVLYDFTTDQKRNKRQVHKDLFLLVVSAPEDTTNRKLHVLFGSLRLEAVVRFAESWLQSQDEKQNGSNMQPNPNSRSLHSHLF
jgi:hypothetical protein